MPLQTLHDWNPLSIDALGLVTIFGAHEMDTAVGRLTSSCVTDWLPVLATHTVASNLIAQPRPGFVLYNATDSILATDVSNWLARWLLTQPITHTASVIRLGLSGRRMPAYLTVLSIALGTVCFGGILGITIAQGDYWGVTNVVAMAVSVLVRQGMVGMLHGAIDRALTECSGEPADDVKVFLTLPNGSAVTILGPRTIITGCLLTDPKPWSPGLYLSLRALGWIAFGAHVIALGISTLASQILSVALLLATTILKAYGVGDRRYCIGSRLNLDFEKGNSSWTRKPAYIRLDLTTEEENTMVHWSLMPQRGNITWWTQYRNIEAEMHSNKTMEKEPKREC